MHIWYRQQLTHGRWRRGSGTTCGIYSFPLFDRDWQHWWHSLRLPSRTFSGWSTWMTRRSVS
jgi:hypothetical protein